MNAIVALPPEALNVSQPHKPRITSKIRPLRNVLAGERHRLFKFSLQLQIRDDAAGKRERTDERRKQHGARNERRDASRAVCAALEFQTRDQRRRTAAEAVEERDHLRHRGHLHRIRPDRTDDEADDRADGDECVIEGPALRPDMFTGGFVQGQESDEHAGGRHEVADTRRLGRRQQLDADDEQHRNPDDDVGDGRAHGFVIILFVNPQWWKLSRCDNFARKAP